MDLKWVIGIPSALVVTVGTLFAIDARYLHKAEAGEMIEQQQQGFLELKLEITRARITYLANKSSLTIDEQEELAFLREQVKVLQGQLGAK